MSSASEPREGGALYVCGTPIGNLEDITLRVLRVLREVDLVAAEDTRRTLQLLNHFEIRKPLMSLHEHNEAARRDAILRRLEAGERVALVSDAGMPGISDPGAIVIEAAVEAGYRVVPVPGPTALIAALVGSGLAMDRFVFEGFLPRGERRRRERLELLSADERTLLFYEAPHRLLGTLKAMVSPFGAERSVVIARELTKVHESFVRGRLAEVIDHFTAKPPRGECVIVVAGRSVGDEAPQQEGVSDQAIREAVVARMRAGASRRDAVREVASQWQLARRRVYAIALNEVPEESDV